MHFIILTMSVHMIHYDIKIHSFFINISQLIYVISV